MAKALYFFVLLVRCGLAQTVEGSVFDASTGAGASGVKVELLKGATPFYETATDGGGRFRFDNVREGDYAARYQSPAYWLTAGPSDYRQFHVAADAPVSLEVRLMPWSRITGRVVDTRGNGVPNAPLELTGSGMTINGRTYLRTSWGGGGGGQLSGAPLPMSFRGTAGADGRFEVQLMPGAYGLCATPPPGLKPPPIDKDGPALSWTRTCYPGVSSEGASKLVVLAGAEVLDVELKLLAVPTHAIRGIVLDPEGAPAPKAKITVGEAFRSFTTESKTDGTFEFPELAAGEWRFTAEASQGTVRLRAAEWIDLGGHDLENVKLRLAAPLTLRGKLILEAPQGAPQTSPAPKPGPFILSLGGGRARHDDDLGFLLGAPLNPDANGDIVQEAYPGVYRLGPLLQPPPQPYYLDAVLLNGADLLVQEAEITSGATISVIYKSNGGAVRGVVENCASGGVLLLPQDPSLPRRGFSRSGPCEAGGRYEIKSIRPGEYYALAFAGNGPVPTVDEALLKQAVKVTVRSGEAAMADLRAITRPIF